MVQYAKIKEIVEFGLDKIPVEQTISVNLKEFMYIYRVLEEYMRFFHQPDHYPTIEEVEKFLGDNTSGEGFEVLSTAIYQNLYKVKLPKEMEDMINNSTFENPLDPNYYNIDES
ncbi:hypothetical protein [Listeria seeligeri]|uniref:hypothetical protein n=1 Tax=Listeria seeligeri TaxID=1640 RepID=UPI0022EBBC88|nr:hypothetical protein [Listeria seeligeri]